MSPEDSLEACNFFVEDWIRRKLLIQKSIEYLPETVEDIDQQVEDYRESLLLYHYESKLIKQNLDTLVEEEEIENYFFSNPSKFVLKDAVVKARYFIVKLESPEIDSLRMWFEHEGEIHDGSLNDYGFQYASNFSVSGEWFELPEFKRTFPIGDIPVDRFIKENEYVELRDSTNLYILDLKGFVAASSGAPMDYKRHEIEQIIIRSRKMRFIKEVKNKIYEDAFNKGEFEIYDD